MALPFGLEFDSTIGSDFFDTMAFVLQDALTMHPFLFA